MSTAFAPRILQPVRCFHGGAFFEAIGERFDDLARRSSVINADVLDAWFPPAPGVVEAIRDHLPWLANTSPPTDCAGLEEAIAEARGLGPANVLAGGGSSNLIFLAFREWLTPRSRVLILDPCYGEYAHVLEQVVRCRVERFGLCRADGWAPDLDALDAALRRGFDLVVIVNPNNPTGHHIPRSALEALIATAPRRTRVWVDEAYLEYVAPGQSLEHFILTRPGGVVCKSMSKVYALSGMRVAYLAGSPGVLAPLRRLTPPWSVGLPAQVAGVRALADPDYYAARYLETAVLRAELEQSLRELPGLEHVSGNANFILCHLERTRPTAACVIEACRREGVYLRDVSSMGRRVDARTFRVAVKDRASNARLVSALSGVLGANR